MGNTDEEAMLDKIRKLLESAGWFERNFFTTYVISTNINKELIYFLLGVYSKVHMIVGRIFQRVPDLLQELEDQVEEEGGSQTTRKRLLIELVLEKVCHS